MNRVEFTKALNILLMKMFEANEKVLIDYVKRSDEEQLRLFQQGKSKCNGTKNRSAHQDGKAVDIYFMVNGGIGNPKLGYNYWHSEWCFLNGKPMIEWDKGHFE